MKTTVKLSERTGPLIGKGSRGVSSHEIIYPRSTILSEHTLVVIDPLLFLHRERLCF